MKATIKVTQGGRKVNKNHKIGDIVTDNDTKIKYKAVPKEIEGMCIGCDFRSPEMKGMCFKHNRCEGLIYKVSKDEQQS
jgi:hypothetical protein